MSDKLLKAFLDILKACESLGQDLNPHHLVAQTPPQNKQSHTNYSRLEFSRLFRSFHIQLIIMQKVPCRCYGLTSLSCGGAAEQDASPDPRIPGSSAKSPHRLHTKQLKFKSQLLIEAKPWRKIWYAITVNDYASWNKNAVKKTQFCLGRFNNYQQWTLFCAFQH